MGTSSGRPVSGIIYEGGGGVGGIHPIADSEEIELPQKMQSFQAALENNGQVHIKDVTDILLTPDRFSFPEDGKLDYSKSFEKLISCAVYLKSSEEYIKFKALKTGLKFLGCVINRGQITGDDLKDCAKETIKSAIRDLLMDFASDTIEGISDKISNRLWIEIQSDLQNNGVSTEDMRPIEHAFKYACKQALNRMAEEGISASVDFAQNYVEEYLAQTDLNFYRREMTTNSNKYRDYSPRLNYNTYTNNSQIVSFENALIPQIREFNKVRYRRLFGRINDVQREDYDFSDYSEDVGLENSLEFRNKTLNRKNLDEKFTEKSSQLIRFSNGSQEVIKELENLEGLFKGNKMPTIIRDFLRIAKSLFYYDTCKQRNKDSNEARKYTIKILTPLDSEWNKDEVQLLLKRTMFELMQEGIEFKFEKSDEKLIPLDFTPEPSRITCLFSGGIDSLSGAVDLIKNKEGIPYFVCLNTGSSLKDTQTELLQKISGKLKVGFDSLFYPYSKGDDCGSVSLSGRHYHPMQRSRSLVFLSVALAYSASINSAKIKIYENGIMANIDDVPFVESESFTRTVHPEFIENLNKLVKLLMHKDFAIENPFNYKTKKEVIELIESNTDRSFAVGMIKNSISCSNENPILGFNRTYCGVCTPCIMKRLSLLASRVKNEKELIHPTGLKGHFKDALKFERVSNSTNGNKWNTRWEKPAFEGELTVKDLYFFAGKFRLMEKKDLIREFPKLADERYFELFKRFSDELLSVNLPNADYPEFNDLKKRVVS